MQSTPPAPVEPPLVTTDRDRYRVRRVGNAIELDIVTTFTNRTAATRTDTARVRASTDANSFPRFESGTVSGTYRLVYAQAYGSWHPNEGPGDLLPLERRASAAFRIEE